MIDIESKVFATVAGAVRTAHSGTACYSEYTPKIATFPAMVLCEVGNATYQKSLTNVAAEQHADIIYQLDVYSDNGKLEAKSIMATADNAMLGMMFERTTMTQMPRMERDIYRITARYRAIVGQGVADGTNTTYQLYRK